MNTGTPSEVSEVGALGYGNRASVQLSAAEYRALVDNSPVMIWRSGVDARCNYFNETWLAFTGRSLAEELDDGWASGVHPDDLQACVGRYREHFQKRERFEIEYRLRRYDGEYRWILDRGAPMYAEDGRFEGFIGSCVDVHESHVAEQTEEELHRQTLGLYNELKEREAKIRRLMDANIVGVVFSTLEGEIFEANDAFLRMLGFTRADMRPGLRWREMTPPEWSAASESAAAQVRATGSCDVFQKEYFRKDGSRVPVLIGLAAVDGGRDETVAFVLDITEQKRADEERERLRAELAYMNRVLTIGELAAALAHDVKQPITAAMASADSCQRLLNRPALDVGELRQAAARVAAEVAHANQVIDRVRVLYTRSVPRKEIVDANELIRDMVALLSGEATQHHVLIRAELQATLPMVAVDRVQLQQVLLNLMLNAIEAMKGAPGELLIASRRTATNGVTISVTDSGVGLPMGQTDHIFDAFFTTKPEGMGMGLAISRAIVESHGGRLWAHANAERGATFQFTLPDSSGE
jgi:PAS domain S-box-containing protein